MKSRGWIAALLALAWAPLPAVASDFADVSAAWKRYEVEFVYMGFTTHYSCDGLRDKLKLLLLHAGVRPDIEVKTRGCAVGFERIPVFPRVQMVFYAPEIPVAGQKEVGDPTLGSWRKVSIARGHPRDLELGDCELVEQFRDRLLPQLTTRSVTDKTNCIPHQLFGSWIKLDFEMLVGAPTPDAPDMPP